MQPRDSELERHVAFADALADWIRRAGVNDGEAVADLAVGFADTIYSALRAQLELESLLRLDPGTPEGADTALGHLGYLHALFLTEIKPHVLDLETRWETLEECLSAKLPDDSDD